MNDFKNQWEAEEFVNPWEVGGGLSVLDREEQPIPTNNGLIFSKDGKLIGSQGAPNTISVYLFGQTFDVVLEIGCSDSVQKFPRFLGKKSS